MRSEPRGPGERAGRGSACCGQLHGSGGREADLAHPGERVEEPHAASARLQPLAMERRTIKVEKPRAA